MLSISANEISIQHMKNITLLFIFVAFSFATHADSFAEQTCLHAKGKIKKLSTLSQRPDVFQFCFFRDAGMELQTFVDSQMNDFAGPEANKAYRQTLESDILACSRFGGESVAVKDDLNLRSVICLFRDKSAISESTLKNGVHSTWNKDFNKALGIIY